MDLPRYTSGYLKIWFAICWVAKVVVLHNIVNNPFLLQNHPSLRVSMFNNEIDSREFHGREPQLASYQEPALDTLETGEITVLVDNLPVIIQADMDQSREEMVKHQEIMYQEIMFSL